MTIQWNPSLHGKVIREARLNEEWTQQDLANQLGVTQSIVSQWETGKITPSPAQIADMENLFGPGIFANPVHESDASLLGGWVRTQREEKGWTRQELARRAGISYPTVINIETGRSANPQQRTQEKLQAVFSKEIPSDIRTEIANEADIGVEGVGALIDFDPYAFDELPKVPGVYVFYDISDRPVYVGKGAVIADRVKNHEQKFWYKSPIVYKASYVRIDDKTLRDQIERVMIRFMKSNAVINRQLVERGEEDSE